MKLKSKRSKKSSSRKFKNMKLYILVRRDLTPSQQAVQAGHALAAFLLKNPNCEWKNETLIYLGVKNEESLEKWKFKLQLKEINFAEFREPDMNCETTAISTYTEERVFKNMELL